ncbi:MAG TPA: hypothetical protein VFE51_20615 [Verrucomicrobiae bacterium]|nr:hypothetical protein [Verrucomicrobiae bacterium]
MSDPLQQVVGKQLSAVTFVQDYLQLHFDGPTLNAMTVVTVITPKGFAKMGDDQFRNLLCSCITKQVSRIEFMDQEALVLHFDDCSLVTVSLRGEDYRGAEAVTFHGAKNEILAI